MSDELLYDPNIQNVLEQKELKWIFVGGKGGVGKTSVSCSLALQLAKIRRSVLLISTDPAHNISDSFEQQFTRAPTKVNGVANLMAMEVDSSPPDESLDQMFSDQSGEGADFTKGIIKDLIGNLPGLDEAMALTQIMTIVEQHDFDCVVFDTAPTGHTLRLLSIPTAFEKGLKKIIQMKSMFGGLMSSMGGALGMGNINQGDIDQGLEKMLPVVQKLNAEIKNPDMTTFVCVCIPEFLSLYETERLIQKLTVLDIDTHNVIVNQIVYPDKDKMGEVQCGLCLARTKMQGKYLEQINDLYEDFNVTKMPLLPREVKGVKTLQLFGGLLKDPPNMKEKSVHDLVTVLEK